jgi:hypothetical protein
MTRPVDMGLNRTGMATSPIDKREMIENARAGVTGSVASTSHGISAERVEYATDSPPIGTVPPPATVKGAVKMIALPQLSTVLVAVSQPSRVVLLQSAKFAVHVPPHCAAVWPFEVTVVHALAATRLTQLHANGSAGYAVWPDGGQPPQLVIGPAPQVCGVHEPPFAANTHEL